MNDQLSQIHPDLQQAVKWVPGGSVTRKNLWLVRFLIHMMPPPRVPKDIFVEDLMVPGQDGLPGTRVRTYRPKSISAPTPVLFWLHGGGYVMGKPEMDDLRCTQYVRQLGLSVISVDYRLAPEYPFPAALDDCYAAIRWAGSHHHQLGIDPQHFAVGGSSAGGGLAAALAQRTRDRQEFKLLFQLLIYPMLDHRTAIRVDFEDSKNILWTQKSNRFGWESYLGKMCGTEHVPAYSAPARCQDLSGLPPAWIGVGTSDLFHDEDTAYAQRLKECGLSCELEVVQGAFHGFDVLATQAPISQAFQKSQLAALKRYLFPSDTTDA